MLRGTAALKTHAGLGIMKRSQSQGQPTADPDHPAGSVKFPLMITGTTPDLDLLADTNRIVMIRDTASMPAMAGRNPDQDQATDLEESCSTIEGPDHLSEIIEPDRRDPGQLTGTVMTDPWIETTIKTVVRQDTQDPTSQGIQAGPQKVTIITMVEHIGVMEDIRRGTTTRGVMSIATIIITRNTMKL